MSNYVNASDIPEAVVADYLKNTDPKVHKLIRAMESKLTDLAFLVDDSAIDRAIKGFDKPDLEERIDSQLETIVTRDLRNKAAEAAEDGATYIPPTKDEIEAEIAKRKANRLIDIKKKQDSKVRKARSAIMSEVSGQSQ